jgi:hypothetical protein
LVSLQLLSWLAEFKEPSFLLLITVNLLTLVDFMHVFLPFIIFLIDSLKVIEFLALHPSYLLLVIAHLLTLVIILTLAIQPFTISELLSLAIITIAF